MYIKYNWYIIYWDVIKILIDFEEDKVCGNLF